MSIFEHVIKNKGVCNMPMVKFPYTKEGEKNAKAAAREYGGKYISDKKDKGGGGASIMIAVGSPVKKKKKSPARRTTRKKG